MSSPGWGISWPEQGQATVPTAVAPTAAATSGELNTADLLKSIQGDTTRGLQLARQAASPVAARQTGQIPSSMARPITGSPDVQGYANPRSKGQGIANMITAAGNAVGNVITAERQKKQEHLTDQATKLFTAQAAKNEAQQQYDSVKSLSVDATGEEAKGYLSTMDQAKKAMDHNDEIIKGITTSKDAKSLAKGLHLNYIDPSENKTEEHAAVQKAIQNAKTIQEKKAAAAQAKQQWEAKTREQSGQNFAQAFEKSQPQTLAPNVMAQQQLGAFQVQQKAAQVAQKDLMNFSIAMRKTEVPLEVAQYKGMADGIKQQALFEQQDALLAKKTAAAQRLLGAKISAEYGLVAARGAEAIKVHNATHIGKDDNPLMIQNKLLTAANSYDKLYTATNSDKESLIKKRDAKYKTDSQKRADSQGYQAMNVQIHAMEQQEGLYQQMRNNSATMASSLLKGGEGGSNGASARAGAGQFDTAGSDEDEDQDLTNADIF